MYISLIHFNLNLILREVVKCFKNTKQKIVISIKFILPEN